MIGSLVDRALERFASWAVREHPAPPENSSETAGFCARVIRDYRTGAPYITRVLFPRLFGVRPLLHHIHRDDHERDLHNHPWTWSLSIILRGSYDEERPDLVDDKRIRTRRVRWFNFIRGTDVHRITQLHGEVWTLFVSGPRVQSWGFREWDSDSWSWQITPSKLYIARRKAIQT